MKEGSVTSEQIGKLKTEDPKFHSLFLYLEINAFDSLDVVCTLTLPKPMGIDKSAAGGVHAAKMHANNWANNRVKPTITGTTQKAGKDGKRDATGRSLSL